MNDEPVVPDPVVRTAIQLLPVPDHEPAFWADLHSRLDAEPSPAAIAVADHPAPRRRVVVRPDDHLEGVELVPLMPLGVVPPALRRRSNAVLSAVAVAAAVLVVVAGTTLVRQRTDGDAETDVAAEPASTTTAAASSMATLTGSAAQLPTDTVLAWVSALGEGDTAGAWGSLGPASRSHFGSQSAFAAEGSALAEGYGAWSGAEPDVLVTPLPSSGGGQLVVVTLVGEVQQDGATLRRADAFPVRIVDGHAKVEMWAFAGELQLVVPEGDPRGHERPTVDEDDELVVVIPRGVQAPTLRLDDGEALVCGRAEGTTLEQLEAAPGQRCAWAPEGGIPAGERVLTVAFLSPDGDAVSAEAVVFEAA